MNINGRGWILVLACCALLSCAQQPARDPLQNTRKLTREGHATLYRNGAFEVPMTTIHLIPPGPGAWELASEMAGTRAKLSFQESVKHARESVNLTKTGIEKSVQAGKAINQGAAAMAGTTRDFTHFGVRMATSSPEMISGAVSASVTFADKAQEATTQGGAQLATGSLEAGKDLSTGSTRLSGQMWRGAQELAKDTSAASRSDAARHISFGAERFVQGYAALPQQLGQRAAAVADSASLDHFVSAYRESNEWRAAQSGKMVDILSTTTSNYSQEVAQSFTAARWELDEGSKETGYTLALLKSLRWVVQGIFWDATIKPAGKMATASLGYLTVNTLAFPVMVTVREGVAVANIAVEVTWNSAAAVYDVTAPSATAALAGLFGAAELVGGQVLAGGELAAGAAASAGTYGIGQTAAAATAAGGYAAGKTVQYVGAPLSTVGVAAGGSAIGVVVGAGTAVTGGAVAVTGVTGEAVTRVAGNAAAGTVTVGGSAASVVAGTALGTYELSKAVVVPVGYELGSGLVLSYGTLSQLSAQTLLAVADASYMVLSLEGPNWVLYAVSGKLDDGEHLPTGTMLDLKAMQQAGETFVAVPVSAEEMKRMIETAPAQLPVTATPRP